jgi:hypothetical protein
MPAKWNEECLEGLFKVSPEVNVLVTSGYCTGAAENEVTEPEAVGFVGKPSDMTQSLQEVRRLLYLQLTAVPMSVSRLTLSMERRAGRVRRIRSFVKLTTIKENTAEWRSSTKKDETPHQPNLCKISTPRLTGCSG